MKPSCFGMFRSPQSDAENDCISCQWDRNCMYRFAYAAGLERAAEIAETTQGAWNARERRNDDPSPRAIAASIRAEKEADHG